MKSHRSSKKAKINNYGHVIQEHYYGITTGSACKNTTQFSVHYIIQNTT